LMRFLGLITFTAMAAYAIKLTPALKWAICAHRDAAGIDLQSVGAQRRWRCAGLRLGDHSPLFQRGPAIWAGLGALAVDDALRTQQTAADRVRAVGVDGMPDDGAAEAVEQPSARRRPQLNFVAAMGPSSLRRYSGVASC